MASPNTIAVFSEIIAIDQRFRLELAKVLPKGMELSHFSALNHLATVNAERTPAQLSKALNVSRGAMTNTLSKLEARGYVHIRPDWEDARSKFVSISDAGRMQRDMALSASAPLFEDLKDFSEEDLRRLVGMLRQLREGLSKNAQG